MVSRSLVLFGVLALFAIQTSYATPCGCSVEPEDEEYEVEEPEYVIWNPPQPSCKVSPSCAPPPPPPSCAPLAPSCKPAPVQCCAPPPPPPSCKPAPVPQCSAPPPPPPPPCKPVPVCAPPPPSCATRSAPSCGCQEEHGQNVNQGH